MENRGRLLSRVLLLLGVVATSDVHGFCEMQSLRSFAHSLLQLRGGVGNTGGGKQVASMISSATPDGLLAAGVQECKVFEGASLAPKLRSIRKSLLQPRDTSSLMVIADFDRTLSAFRGPNGEPCEECHDIIFNKCSPTSSWSADVEAFWALTREKFGTLADKPVAQQLALTEWWWTEANAMMLRHNLTESNVVEAIHQANTVLRPGAISFLTNCISEGIPVMIVSAGLNKVIREFLRKHDTSGTLLQSPMLTIHANEMEFDADGRLCGFGKHLITTRNKRDVLHSPGASAQLHQLTHSRRHVLLLGDNINDVDVVADLPPTVKAIKIGFANRPDANVSQYLERYDVVVTEDGPMDYIQHQLLPQLVSR